ncbi:MAG: transporter [bacterium]|nr:transporter [bacterium]
MKKAVLISSIAFQIIVSQVFAQNKTDNVRLFQSYFFDVPIAKTIYLEPGLEYATSSTKFLGTKFSISSFVVGAKGGYPINEKIELGAQLGFLNLSADPGDSESGLTDVGVYGRYNIITQDALNFSAGALVTLPIGEEKVGQSNLNFGAFGAIRYSLDNGFVLTGNLGIIFYETTTTDYKQTGTDQWGYPIYEYVEETNRENYLNLGFGGIYTVSPELNIVGELTIKTEMDYMMLSGGVDYLLGTGRLRGALGLGLDDGAPDFQIMLGYGLSF